MLSNLNLDCEITTILNRALYKIYSHNVQMKCNKINHKVKKLISWNSQDVLLYLFTSTYFKII